MYSVVLGSELFPLLNGLKHVLWVKEPRVSKPIVGGRFNFLVRKSSNAFKNHYVLVSAIS